jgi:hypothetical protein
MKHSNLPTGLLGLVTLTLAASAQGAFTYTPGDLILAFKETGHSDVVVNLGNADTFLAGAGSSPLSLSSVFEYSLGGTTHNAFTEAFGTGVGVSVAVFNNFAASSTPINTSYLSTRRDSPLTPAVPLKEVTTSGAQGNKSAVEGMMGVGKLSGIGFATTANGNGGLAIIDSTSLNSYTVQYSTTLLVTKDTLNSSAVPAGGSAVVDLYKVDRSATIPKPDGQFLGSFSLDSTGALLYSKTGDFTAVPEPAEYSLAFGGLILGGALLRRKLIRQA